MGAADVFAGRAWRRSRSAANWWSRPFRRRRADGSGAEYGGGLTASIFSGGAEIGADITNGSILHADGGSVSGTVKNGYQNYSNPGTISGGEFTGTGFVTNNGTISGGTFSETKEVSNSSGGTITGGTFNGLVINSGGTITGGSCTRAQIVTFLWRAAGCPEPKSGVGSAAFPDVPADSYYAAAVAWAVANGVTTGTKDDGFSPNAACTRARIVTFLHRSAK